MTNTPPNYSASRELSIGEVIETTFSMYQRDFSKYLPLFLVVGAITGILNYIVALFIVLPRMPVNATAQQLISFFPGYFVALAELLLALSVITITFYPITLGSAIKIASDRIERGQSSLGAAIKVAASKLLSIWALSIIVGLIVIAGIIALIVPGIILAIMFSLSYPVLIIENKSVAESIGRSRLLVSHRWGKTLGCFIVIGIIAYIASAIIGLASLPFGTLSPIIRGVLSAFVQPWYPILLTVYYYSMVARTNPPPLRPITPGPYATPQMGMKFCIECGTPMMSASMICPKCGMTQPA